MQNREKFSSRLGFILISAGCAIGLGNVYRFPIITGAYGGAFFVLLYLAFLMLLGIPVMCAELANGRASQKSVAQSYDVLEKPGQKWHLAKILGISGNYLLMMMYTCITAWVVIYFFKYLTGSIMVHTTVDQLGGVFGGMVTNMPMVILTAVGVILAGFGICSLGLQNGVEKITKVMMVALLGLLMGLAVYCCTLDGAGEGLKFYLLPSVENIRNTDFLTIVTAAMGQSFFTLSLGIGSIAIFGSYIDKDRSLLGEAATITALDTFVALCSGFIIFPACFTFAGGVNADASTVGAKFLFTTLSSIFNTMPAGRIVGTLFFLFMTFAAFSTVIAVFENIMSFWLDMTKLSRRKIALINILLISVLSLPAILSCGPWDHILVFGKNFMDLEDYTVSNILLPVGSLIYVLFCTTRYGWGWSKFEAEMNAGSGLKLPRWMKPYMTYVLPLIIIAVLIMSIF